MEVDTSRRGNGLAFCRLSSFLGLAVALPSLFWYLLETWQRPLSLLRVDERLLAVAGAGGLLLALFAWPLGWTAGTVWRRATCGVLIFAGWFAGGALPARKIAVHELMRHPMVEMALEIERPDKDDAESWLDPAFEWLEGHGVPVPNRRRGHQPDRYTTAEEPLWHLLECSRWQVRSGFMRRLMESEKGATFLVNDWQALFPAITGQDVTLARRSEMLEWLEMRANDPSAPAAIRDAATFWMGLIVLTDPEAFARWRVPVRDAMLACDNPPMASTGDVWMRVLDMLLAHDPPDERIALLAPLSQDPLLLRRALRERLRGVEGYLPQLLREMESEESYGFHHSAIAIWLDLKHLAERMPESAQLTALLDRLRDTLAGWLTQDRSSLIRRFMHRTEQLMIHPSDVMMEMPEHIQTRLDAHAHQLLDDFIVEEARGYVLPPEFEQALMIRNFIDPNFRLPLSRRIADLMVNELWDIPRKNRKSVFLLGITSAHAAMWQDLTTEQQARFGRLIRSRLAPIELGSKPTQQLITRLSTMRFMQAAVGLEEAEWLAMAVYPRAEGDGSMDAEIWWRHDHNVEPGFFSRDAVEKAIATFEQGRVVSTSKMRFATGEDAIVFPKIPSLRILEDASKAPDPKQFFLHFLASNGLAAIEDFPDDAPALMIGHPELLEQMLEDPSLERLSRWLEKPGVFSAILECKGSKKHPHPLRKLPDYLLANPPPQPVLEEILAHQKAQSMDDQHTSRLNPHRNLFRMIPLMPPAKRHPARVSFFRFMLRARPTPASLAVPIPWRDDALSATFGWHAQIFEETHDGGVSSPPPGNSTASNAVFRHLAFACDPFIADKWQGWIPYPIDSPVPKSAWRTAPPNPAAEPTPWQRARELSLRRPDLDFPDRMIFRPGPRAYLN